jgi:hypothetical protein
MVHGALLFLCPVVVLSAVGPLLGHGIGVEESEICLSGGGIGRKGHKVRRQLKFPPKRRKVQHL